RRRGRVEFVPIRYFDLVTQFAAGGTWAPDCVLVHCAPPDARGYLSLGVSVSVALPAARRAPLVIAQVNPSMPRTRGNACLHRSQIDCWVEVDEPLTPYPPTPIGDVERAIGRHVAAITSALEIDLTGQVTAESLGPRQVAGIGGQFDFVLGASRSHGGAAVIALPSTGRDGAVSRIVPSLQPGAAVTSPRALADWVV